MKNEGQPPERSAHASKAPPLRRGGPCAATAGFGQRQFLQSLTQRNLLID